MHTKLILASVLLMSLTCELFAMEPDSKELVKPTNKIKQESPIVKLLKKIKEKNTPEYSRNCCCSSWKRNTDALNLTLEIEQEIKRNGISSDDYRQLSSIAHRLEYNRSVDCLCPLAGILTFASGAVLLDERLNPVIRQRSLAVFTLSCLTCTAIVGDVITEKGCLATGKSPYLRNVLTECEKNKTCPGKIEMVYSPNTAQETLPLLDAQDNV